MKNLFIIALLSLAAHTATAQALATNGNTAGGSLSIPYAVEVTDHYTIITGYRTSAIAKANSIAPNYAKMSLVQLTATLLSFKTSFEGTSNLQYIVTNSEGEVVAIQEVKLLSGPRVQNIDMSKFANGDYFITANVTSRETKANSTYCYKVEKK